MDNADRLTRISNETDRPEESIHSVSSEGKTRIISQIRNHLALYPEVVFAYMHGSFTEEPAFRDVDIAIYFTDSMSHRDQFQLCLALAAEISHLVGVQADVHSLNIAPVEFRYHATRGLILYSRDEETRCDFLEDTWMRYFDFQTFLEESLADLLS